MYITQAACFSSPDSRGVSLLIKRNLWVFLVFISSYRQCCSFTLDISRLADLIRRILRSLNVNIRAALIVALPDNLRRNRDQQTAPANEND